MFRRTALFACVAVCSAVDLPAGCIDDVANAAKDIGAVVVSGKSLVTTCQNGTEADCIQGVKSLFSSVTTVVDETSTAVSACGLVAPQCATDLNACAGHLNTSAADVAQAVEDCAKNGDKTDCVVDVMGAATALTETAVDIYHATYSCKKNSSVAPHATCVEGVVDTARAVRDSADAIARAVKACRKHKDCNAAVEAAVTSIATTSQVAGATAKGCHMPYGTCISDITDAVAHLLDAAVDIDHAVTDCKHGIFNMHCIDTLVEVGSQAAKAVLDVVQAVAACKVP